VQFIRHQGRIISHETELLRSLRRRQRLTMQGTQLFDIRVG